MTFALGGLNSMPHSRCQTCRAATQPRADLDYVSAILPKMFPEPVKISHFFRRDHGRNIRAIEFQVIPRFQMKVPRLELITYCAKANIAISLSVAKLMLIRALINLCSQSLNQLHQRPFLVVAGGTL